MMVLAVGWEVCPASGGVGEGVDRNPAPQLAEPSTLATLQVPIIAD
ncbi:MAG: hypothetical protein HC916_04265 [Coleofasciculaceae cyanobacterium SM2_1_6]|nr:hypothetical protein [Coleofasciculaceae cyanobacterium SM2_1_6]